MVRVLYDAQASKKDVAELVIREFGLTPNDKDEKEYRFGV